MDNAIKNKIKVAAVVGVVLVGMVVYKLIVDKRKTPRVEPDQRPFHEDETMN